jgi:neopullulanase
MELAVLLQATLPGAPCTYYGNEVGLKGGIDPDSRRAFPWDESRWDHQLLESVRSAFALRRAEPALRSDVLTVTAAADASLVFERGSGDRRMVVAMNPGDAAATVPLPLDPGPAGRHGTVAFAAGRARAERAAIVAGEGSVRIELPPRAGVVIRAD